MAEATAQNEWVRRVLGLTVGGSADEAIDGRDEDLAALVPRALAGLPAVPGALSPQAKAFIAAAVAGMPFCEECFAELLRPEAA